MTNKDLYCLYRAVELHETLGLTLGQGWNQAAREWSRCACVPQNIDRRDVEYDDDIDAEEFG